MNSTKEKREALLRRLGGYLVEIEPLWTNTKTFFAEVATLEAELASARAVIDRLNGAGSLIDELYAEKYGAKVDLPERERERAKILHQELSAAQRWLEEHKQ